ncbi:MAG: hypothetical protein H7Z43_01085, partial [Clostridia bacterium]|nr:hypothetical protein [Deltaproteobacteria bacterium]
GQSLFETLAEDAERVTEPIDAQTLLLGRLANAFLKPSRVLHQSGSDIIPHMPRPELSFISPAREILAQAALRPLMGAFE